MIRLEKLTYDNFDEIFELKPNVSSTASWPATVTV